MWRNRVAPKSRFVLPAADKQSDPPVVAWRLGGLTGVLAATGEDACTGEAHAEEQDIGGRFGNGKRRGCGQHNIVLTVLVGLDGCAIEED
jgi:hypothetical protein